MGINTKMQEHDVLTLVIPQLQTLYAPPQPPRLADGADNPSYTAMVKLFCRDLRGFSREQYERGMAEFRKDWTYRRWPTVGELLRYFDAERANDNKALPAPERGEDKPSPRSYNANPAAYVAETERLRAENDRRDRAAGRTPLGKPASQSTRQQRDRYRAQFPEGAMRRMPAGPIHVPRERTPEATATNRDQETEEAAE